jgi:hypothetical protein
MDYTLLVKVMIVPIMAAATLGTAGWSVLHPRPDVPPLTPLHVIAGIVLMAAGVVVAVVYLLALRPAFG